MNAIVRPFIASFAYSNNLVRFITDDLSRQQALFRTRDGEGASVLWTLGHLYDYRCMALELLGVEKEREYGQLFSEESASDGTGYPELEELLHKWDILAEELESALARTTEEDLIASEENGARLFNALTFYTWHEASHFGAISTIRKEQGLPSAAEIVMAHMEKLRQEAESEGEEGEEGDA